MTKVENLRQVAPFHQNGNSMPAVEVAALYRLVRTIIVIEANMLPVSGACGRRVSAGVIIAMGTGSAHLQDNLPFAQGPSINSIDMARSCLRMGEHGQKKRK